MWLQHARVQSRRAACGDSIAIQDRRLPTARKIRLIDVSRADVLERPLDGLQILAQPGVLSTSVARSGLQHFALAPVAFAFS